MAPEAHGFHEHEDARTERRRAVRLRRSKLAESIPHLSFKIAHTTAELEQAFELVWRQYRSVGLEGDNSSGIRLTKYHLLPFSKVFVVIAQDNPNNVGDKSTDVPHVIGTVTLILDGAMGLPVEEVCREELNHLRNQGRNLAEVVALAIDPEFKRQELDVVMHMFRIVFSYAREKNVNDLLCSVTKRHIEFYRTLLFFKPMGEMKPYSYANRLEVQGHRLDIKLAERLAKKVYSDNCFDADLHSFFFTDNLQFGRSRGEGCSLSPEQLRYFLSERTRMIESLDDQTLNLLRAEYERMACPFLGEAEIAKWRNRGN
jgi:hypothetical protein